jgi:hypothetical protein
MLLLNKICLPINAVLIILNLWLHHPGFALLAAVSVWCNLTVIKSIEENNGLRNRE